MNNFLAIDQGTTSSRAIVFSSDHKVITDSQEEYSLSYPSDGWVEAEPNDILKTVKQTLKNVLKETSETITCCGIESKYGLRTGTFKTFDTLASLSLGPNEGRRAKFYKDELINFLLMCRENKLDPRNIKGSYAGALGKPQFISSSYRHYAIDFNGDNVVDLWNSNEDVIGSVANYFKKNGWKNNQLIMSNTIYKNSNIKYVESESKKTYKPKTPYKVFMNNKLYSDEAIDDNTLLSVIGREEQDGKIYSFAHKNFYVITRYNRSRLYALAVYSLSNQIKRYKSELENDNS